MDKNQTSNDFTDFTIDETLSRLQSNSATGLTQTEAKQRIERYGPNAVEEKQQNPVIAFLKRFWGLTAWMFEIAIVISFVLGDFLDLYIIAEPCRSDNFGQKKYRTFLKIDLTQNKPLKN
jgi:H+-transporting ATPase